MTFGVLDHDGRKLRIVDLAHAADGRLRNMPVTHRLLLENACRMASTEEAGNARAALLAWLGTGSSNAEIPFLPGRILMHDTTCGPALVDVAAMRSAIAEAGGDPERLKPILSVDVSTDHSVAVDFFGRTDAMSLNMAREMERNAERYRLMKWASTALGIRVHPPGTGIMHTLNLERLATVVTCVEHDDALWAAPDTLIGTDSHTPMVNGIGVLGWGVGGIEAESVMFGIPTMLRIPNVIGVRLIGELREGVLATDLALTVTERLRRQALNDAFVEFFGPGVSSLSADDRAVVANMTPEFGGATGYFPIDAATLRYLARTGRSPGHVAFVEAYAKRNSIWHDPDATPRYTEVVDIDLGRVGISLAGPRRPQDRIPANSTRGALGLQTAPSKREAAGSAALPEAPVAIAAITSCTNTSDPRLLIAAGLVAKKANALGLRPPAWVKTSLGPGSPSAKRLLVRSGLLSDLEAIGFSIVGYGCTTCIGNSGPLTPEITDALTTRSVDGVAILSGNRNFPSRVHPDLDLGFLASPPMVVAFALAGTADIDITAEPLARSADGREIRLADLWPSASEIDTALAAACDTFDLRTAYDAAESSEAWDRLVSPTAAVWPWDDRSTYIRKPPFVSAAEQNWPDTFVAVPILVVGDDITTDHISPAGQIKAGSEAAHHLIERGEKVGDLNVFAARRGNWEVMIRGLFTNKSVSNLLAPDVGPGLTVHAGSGDVLPLFEAARRYADEGRSTVIVAGERYGMGSSRDWAAKGVALLGVRVVLAKSFERIHRANLIGMGVLPLILPADIDIAALGLTPDTAITISMARSAPRPRELVKVSFQHQRDAQLAVSTVAAIQTDAESKILSMGGVLPMIIRKSLATA